MMNTKVSIVSVKANLQDNDSLLRVGEPMGRKGEETHVIRQRFKAFSKLRTAIKL
jgi:hypothetical protein